jgi:hypothetical protein
LLFHNILSIFADKDTIFFDMSHLPKLNFPPIRLKARRGANDRTEVFDAVRGRWLVLTPEEWVRRHVVEYLRTECGYAPQLIVEEHPIPLNGMAQRADIVVLNRCGTPYFVVECKEPNVKIDGDVLAQVVRYNSVLGCRYIAITNGLDTYCYAYDDGKYTQINHFPRAEEGI